MSAYLCSTPTYRNLPGRLMGRVWRVEASPLLAPQLSWRKHSFRAPDRAKLKGVTWPQLARATTTQSGVLRGILGPRP